MDPQFHDIGHPRRCRAIQPAEIEKEKLFREGEELLQQPVAHERTVGVREHPLVALEAHGADAGGLEDHGWLSPLLFGRSQLDLNHVVEQKLIQPVDQLPLALQVETQPGEVPLLSFSDLLLQS